MKTQLNDMALFVEIVRAGSFKLASERLNMPLATLSRRFSAFEKQLNLKLLTRNTRSMHLTDIGLFYFEKAKNIIDEADFLNEELKNNLKNPSGKIKLALPVEFTINYLLPILVEFANCYPHIQFDLNLSPQQADLFGEDFDLAIRIGNIQHLSLIAHYSFTLNAQCFASPDYLKNKPAIQTPEDLKNHSVILFSKKNKWVLLKEKIHKEITLDSRFTVNDISLIKNLALQHFGIILLPKMVVQKEIEKGLLVPVLPGWNSPPQPITLLGTTQLLPLKTRLFVNFLKTRFNLEFPR